jgi:uncharacterized membrane protein
MDSRTKLAGGLGVGASLAVLLSREDGRRQLRVLRDHVAGEWTPAARLLAGAAGGGLAFYAARRRGGIGAALGSLGIGLLARGIAERPLRGLARRRSAPLTEVRRAIHVGAPAARLFALWLDSDRLPEFLSRLHGVREIGDGLSVWEGEGPSGEPVEWPVTLTALETDRELAWRTTGDPERAQELRVSFTPEGERTTRVEVHLSCAPSETFDGAGQAVTLFGPDARRLEQDLARMKALAESEGVPAAEGEIR